MVTGVITNLEPAGVEVSRLGPGHVALLVLQKVLGDVEGCAEAELLEQGRGDGVLLFDPIVEGQAHQAVWNRRRRVPRQDADPFVRR